jgi:hypothetical protein
MIDNNGRRGNDRVIIEIIFVMFLISVYCVGVRGIIGHITGYNNGVRDAVAGKATVIDKPDLTTEVVQIKRARQ